MSDPASDPDLSRTLEILLSRAGRGAADVDARRRIDRALRDHLDRLHRFVAVDQLRGFPQQQVEETVADVMEVVLAKPETFEGHSHRDFRAWLFGIARGKCANLRRKRREELPGDDTLLEVGSCAADALGRLREEERERVYARAAGVLAPLDQEVFWMRHVEAYSQEEVAQRNVSTRMLQAE